MASKLLVVIGATGNQGGSVIDTFLKEPDWTIRGLTRNTNTAKAKALQARGVEMVEANLDDPSSLVEAFTGAFAIFSMLDFWNGFFNLSEKAIIEPGETRTRLQWSHDYNLQQGKSVLDAAAQTPGLQRLVFSALSYATKWSGGKYKRVYHYDSEGGAVEYGYKQHPELMKKTSIIQIGMFLTNVLHMYHYRPHKQADDTYILHTKLPETFRMPMIATDEDTGPLVKALLDVEPGKNLLAYREMLTFPEYVETWGRVLGVPAKHIRLAPDEEWVGLPEEIRDDIEEGVAYIAEFGHDGSDPSVVHPKDLAVPLNLGLVEDWIRKQDWSHVVS